MSLCEAEQNVKVGDFVHKISSLKLVRVQRIEEAVQSDGLCKGTQGYAIDGYDAAGNWEWMQPCDWVLVPDPAAFVQGNTLTAQAQFIVETKHWAALAEQLAPWLERTLKWYARNDYEKQLQAKRVGYWYEDYNKNKRWRGADFFNNL